jgi:hypothetical protein
VTPQASLEQRQPFQQLRSSRGNRVDAKRSIRAAVTAPAFSYLQPNRRAAKVLIAEHGATIDVWPAARDQPYEGEAATFFWLREAGEEP